MQLQLLQTAPEPINKHAAFLAADDRKLNLRPGLID